MLHKLFQYHWHKLFNKNKPVRLIMTLLVKNEADIIADNIRVHHKLGVDGFAVMDNGSCDGTLELLQQLKDEGINIHIIHQPAQDYQQAKWMTELAFYARDKMGADMVISNDADEFYIPKNGIDLKAYFTRKDSVVTVRRYNMALDERAMQPGYQYWDGDLKVINPIFYDKSAQLKQDSVSMLLVKISPKAIVNPYGLFRLKGGNHWARHVWRLISKRDESGIEVIHFPIRSYEQFERNIINRKRLIETTNARMGDHYRRWVRLYDEGKLREEFQKFLLSGNDIGTLKKLGVLHCNSVTHFFR